MNNLQCRLANHNQILLDLISNALFNTKIEIGSVDNWKAVWIESYGQTVPLLAFSAADYKQIPLALKEQIKKNLKMMLAVNMQVNRNHSYVHELMTENAIPYVILKGCASAAYYPDPIMRMMGDVDFLVASEDLERAGKLLEKEGFRAHDANHICHIAYRNEKARLEMHFEPSGVPHGKAGEVIREYLQDTIDTAVPISINSENMMIPDDFHHGLIILLHTAHHMTGEGIGLRHLCDWAVFVNKMTNQQFADLFEAKLKRVGMWRFAQLLTQVCIRYLGIDEKAWAGAIDEGLTAQMIEDIFQGGNFGQKIVDRDKEALLISSRGKNGVGKSSIFQQFLISMNEDVYTRWPIMKKVKILVPIGWFRLGMRYIRRRIRGERQALDVGKMIKGAAERKEIYKQFHLFEI